MTKITTPDPRDPEIFTDAAAAVARLEELYNEATAFLCESFAEAMESGAPKVRYRAYYPEIRIRTASYAHVDSRLSFGHVSEPGVHATTVTRPDLFRSYLTQQIARTNLAPVHRVWRHRLRLGRVRAAAFATLACRAVCGA